MKKALRKPDDTSHAVPFRSQGEKKKVQQVKADAPELASKAGAPKSAGWLGGEVTNETNTSWLISGGSNSKESDFHWLPPGTNSDDLGWVSKQLDGDVDAVWPAGKKLMNDSTGEVVTSGAFKLSSIRNTNIINRDGVYVIYDFTEYFTDNNLPPGWQLPGTFKK